MSTIQISAHRGILYIRVSTTAQDQSLPSQLNWGIRRAALDSIALDVTEAMLAEALAQGQHVIGDLYLDFARTGSDSSRPGLQTFLRRAKEDSAITHCLFWSRNRISRTERLHEPMMWEVDILRAGKFIVVGDSPAIDPAQWRQNPMMFALDQVLGYGKSAEFLADLSKSVIRGQADSARKGYWIGGRAPFGFQRYTVNDRTGERRALADGEIVMGKSIKVVVLPGEDQRSLDDLNTAREIHRLYDAGFGGLKAIASELNRRGIPSPDAGRERLGLPVRGQWKPTTIASIIEQPAYAGKYAWGRRAEGSRYRFDPKSPQSFRLTTVAEQDEHGAGRKHVNRNWQEWILVDPAIPFEPIITPELWRSNLARLQGRGDVGGQRGVPRNRGGERKYPLRIVCGSCGRVMSGCPYQGRLVYKCSTYLNGEREACGHHWVDVDIVVPFALEGVRQLVAQCNNRTVVRDALREIHVSQSSDSNRAPSDFNRLERELKRREEERQRVAIDIWASDSDLADDAKAHWSKLKEEIQELRAQLRTLSHRRSVPALDLDTETDGTLALLDDLHSYVKYVPKERLFEVFHALDVVVVVDFERRKVGRRDIVPTKATVFFGGDCVFDRPTQETARGGDAEREGSSSPHASPPSEEESTLCGKDGRGESRLTIPNARKSLLSRLLSESPFRAVWSKAVEMSGWRPLPHKPRARFNGAAFTVRRRGHRTVGEVCKAAGISDSTFRRWEGNRIPRMPHLEGIKAVPESDFGKYVETCRRAYIDAPKTRNKGRPAESPKNGGAS